MPSFNMNSWIHFGFFLIVASSCTGKQANEIKTVDRPINPHFLCFTQHLQLRISGPQPYTFPRLLEMSNVSLAFYGSYSFTTMRVLKLKKETTCEMLSTYLNSNHKSFCGLSRGQNYKSWRGSAKHQRLNQLWPRNFPHRTAIWERMIFYPIHFSFSSIEDPKGSFVGFNCK